MNVYKKYIAPSIPTAVVVLVVMVVVFRFAPANLRKYITG